MKYVHFVKISAGSLSIPPCRPCLWQPGSPGTSCRFCERSDCNQRAAASYRFAFSVDEYSKKDNFFSPLLTHETRK